MAVYGLPRPPTGARPGRPVVEHRRGVARGYHRGVSRLTPPAPRPGGEASWRRGGERPRPPAHRLRPVEETSAGGLVVDLSGGLAAAAIIGRLDRRGRILWSLPKGHVEEGETVEAAAAREIAEETGIQGRVVAPLGTLDYWFVAEDRRVHKTVHHYLLHAEGGELSDADVEVSEVAWVPLDDLSARLAYAGERRLAVAAAALLADPR